MNSYPLLYRKSHFIAIFFAEKTEFRKKEWESREKRKVDSSKYLFFGGMKASFVNKKDFSFFVGYGKI